MIDVSTFIGQYPFRHLPHPDPEVLVKVLDREKLSGAWVGHLPSAFHRDPTAGNEELYERLEPFGKKLVALPAIRPDWPAADRALRDAIGRGAPAIRAYPPQWGMGPEDASLFALAGACAEAGIAIVLTVRFEDLRQRHWMDSAGDLSGAAIRALVRSAPVKVVVTAAGRDLIEEVHWGLTPDEQSRVWWDFSWVWGPPEDHLAHLFRTIGAQRFVYGTQWPLRLTQNPRANLDLLPPELQAASITDGASISRRE
jgi:hypothetical protein